MRKGREHWPPTVHPPSIQRRNPPLASRAPELAKPGRPSSSRKGIAVEALAPGERQATGLQRKPEGGTGTTVAPIPLAALHARVDGAWAQRAGKAARLGHHIARVSLRSPGPEGSSAVQAMRVLDHGAARTKLLYSQQIADTGTASAIEAVVASMSEGSGAYLSDEVLESHHLTSFGSGADAKRVVLPDPVGVKKNPGGYPDVLKNNGRSIEENCAIVAEHELIHLKHASANLAKGIKGSGTALAAFSAGNLTGTVQGLIDAAAALSVNKSGMAVTRLERAKAFLDARLKYILADFAKNARNSEAPAVLRELRRYLGQTVTADDGLEWGAFKKEIERLDDLCSQDVGAVRPVENTRCFITTACVRTMGEDDEGETLTVLREFRDGFLLRQENGRKLRDLYYEVAPQILAALRHRPDEEEILRRLYQGILRRCVIAIQEGDEEFALWAYREMMLALIREFLPRRRRARAGSGSPGRNLLEGR